MTISLSSYESRAGLATSVAAGGVALVAYGLHPSSFYWPQVFLCLSFGGAVLNVIGNDRSNREVSDIDLLLVLITGFAAAAFGAPSIANEAVRAPLRMAILASCAGGLAWGYAQIRGRSVISFSDVKLIAVLSACLPLGLAVYAICFALGTTVITVALLQLWRGGHVQLRQHVPIAAVMAGTFYLVWIARQLIV